MQRNRVGTFHMSYDSAEFRALTQGAHLRKCAEVNENVEHAADAEYRKARPDVGFTRHRHPLAHPEIRGS